MSLWPSVALAGKSPSSSAHPLAGLGRPAYATHEAFPGVYTYREYFLDSSDLKKESLSVFDNRNTWLKKGLSGRLFPTWDAEKFYNQFKQNLFRTLCKVYYTVAAKTGSTPAERPDDYWTDVQLYFFEKTRKEQLDYLSLVETHGSYCHYPLADTYADDKEILLGILHLYHEKIRDLLKPNRNEASSLDELSDERGDKLGQESTDFNEVELAEGLEKALADFPDLQVGKLLEGFLHYLSLDESFEKRIKLLEKKYALTAMIARKAEHFLNARVLPHLLEGHDFSEGLGDNKKKRQALLRQVANRILARSKGKR